MKILETAIALLNRLIPKDPQTVVFCSFPDYSDNAYAVYRQMADNPEKYASYKLIWLVNDPQSVSLPIGKAIKKHSPVGVWHFCRAKTVFHTHGIFGNRVMKGQTNVNLWHGMPLKNIMKLDATHREWTDFTFTYTVATSPLFQEIMCRAFGCDHTACLPVGQPRNDLLFNPPPLSSLWKEALPAYDRIILWMPTYRQSTVGDIREDGNPTTAGIGGFTANDMAVLNAFLITQRTLLVIKVHPMQDLSPFQGMEHSHLRIVTHTPFPLYQLVGAADALLTDYSSVYIDYLLLDRPIGFVVEDWDAYNESRGFVFDNPKEMMPGDIITDKEGVYRFIKDLAEGKDAFAAERKRVQALCHSHTDNRTTFRLLNILGL